MNFWRAILASILSLACTLAVSAFVTLQTVNATVLDRSEVKGWLADSGTYDRLLPTFLKTSQGTQLADAGNAQLQEATRTALAQTFPPSFVQQSSERVLDGVYNWIDSKQPDIRFEINTTPHKEPFIKNLSALVEPQLAALPPCTSLSQFDPNSPRCLPPGANPKQAADAAATDVANRLLIFTQPITTDNINRYISAANPASAPSGAASPQIPRAVSAMRQWLVWLPLIAIASGLLMIALSEHRLKGAKHLAGRLTAGLILTCAAGLVVAYFGQSISLGASVADARNRQVATEIIEPVVRQAAPAMGYQLALVSGILSIVTFAAWITLRIIKQRREHAELLKPDNEGGVQTPTPPGTPKPSKPATS